MRTGKWSSGAGELNMPNFFIGKTVMVLLTVKEESKAEMKATGHRLNNAHFE